MRRNGLKIGCLVVLLLCAALDMAFQAPSALAQKLELPQVALATPSQSLPEDVKEFSCRVKIRWTSWQCPPNHGLDAALAVEKIDSPEKVTVVYSAGISPEWRIRRPTNFRVDNARIERNSEGKARLIFESPLSGKTFIFWFEGGKITGKRGGEHSPITATEVGRY